MTSENVGTRFAIVLDGALITAPVIREAITGGSGQISGGFSNESANNLAIILKSGSFQQTLLLFKKNKLDQLLAKRELKKVFMHL
jgi:preprotein translocase subunit SecD